jgi:voltage-gated potassium channel
VSEQRRLRWEARTEWPLVIAALVFLGAYAWPILDTDLTDGWVTACRTVGVAVWLLFALDFTVRFILAGRKRTFLRGAWLDVITLALPMFRPLRALRAVIALSMLARHGQQFARGKAVAAVVGAVGVISFVAALAMLDAERSSPDANIKTFTDALWWAVVTVPTVGYGDRYPVTAEGRAIAIGLMVTGIALLGVVTAAMASWFVEKVSSTVRQAEAVGDAQIAELTGEVRALREELRELRESNPLRER